MLTLSGISKQFPGVRALDDVSFTVRAGEIHALCGENGAGKSTLLNILTGNLQPDAGRIDLRGQPVRIGSPAAATALGIAIVHQHLSLVESLTVAENIWANRQPRNRWGLIDGRQLNAQTEALLRALNLPHLSPQTRVGTLSAGDRQMVEIAKALSQNPALLLLDEPTASLTEPETQTLFALIRQLRAEGRAVVYISHRLAEIFAVADRVSVLKDGRYQGTLPVAGLSPDVLIARMVGRTLSTDVPPSTATNDVLLSVEHLTGERFRDVSFVLHRGEILGLAGIVGAGRSEIAQALFGAAPVRSGTVRLRGQVVRITHPAEAVRLGIGYLPEERRSLGLFAEQSVAQNIVAARPPARGPWYLARQTAQVADTYRQQLGIRTPSVRTPIAQLSGGNQQKTMLARWLLTQPDVLIVDEPTHGVDVGAKDEIYALLRQLAAGGKAILLISSELPELLTLADRVLVVRDGRLAGELSRANATEERIMQLATTQP